MKVERRIIIHNKRLRRVRNNLRNIIIKAVYDEINRLSTITDLYGPMLDLTPVEEKEVFFLEGTKHILSRALNKSICVCPLCTSDDKDMVYIPEHETWYCIECQEKGLIWYLSHGSEEDRWQHDYINLYHEQKDKFDKRFPNKVKDKPE